MSIVIKNYDIPIGCQRCKFFRKHMFGNGLDYSYSCVLGAKDFPMPYIRQMEERASDCPIEPLEQEPKITTYYTNEKGQKIQIDYDIYDTARISRELLEIYLEEDGFRKCGEE